MSGPLIAFVPGSGLGVGGGHVMRCLALAEALRAAGARAVMVAAPAGAEFARRFGAGIEIVEAPAEEHLTVLNGLGAQAVVVDDFGLGAEFEAKLTAPVRMAIDDLADRPHAVDLLLDPGLERMPGDYAPWIGVRTRLLLGPAYALLRPAFAGAPRREPPAEVGRLFVSFGLSDVEGITGRAVRMLRALAPEAEIDVALAASAESLPSLRAKAADEPRVRLHVDADTAPLMRAAVAAVGAGGSMTWERRALGLPSLVVIVAENQRPGIEALARAGVVLAVDLRAPTFEAEFAAAFARLEDPTQRRAMIDSPLARCDGLGAERAAEALLEEIARKPRPSTSSG